MNPSEPRHELLLRFLEDRVSDSERADVHQWLRADPAARAFLRSVAEQAVMIADLERTARGRQLELQARSTAPVDQTSSVVPGRFRSWRGSLAAAAAIMLLIALAATFLQSSRPAGVRIARVTGASQYFGANGRLENAPPVGLSLVAGDTLETRTCDAWIELQLDDGSTLTLAGQSSLRILDADVKGRHFKLQQGNLWVSPAKSGAGDAVFVHTPTMILAWQDAQLDLQTSSSDTIVRVNQGAATVEQVVNGDRASVPAGHQLLASLSRPDAFRVVPQPRPTESWACDLGRVPEVPVGRWLPSTTTERARLGAAPLLWPIPGREPVLLHAAALSVLSTSDQPVLLQADSRLLFRGRTERPHTVRFGFSTQRMRGVFAGKFEIDVRAEDLGPAGEPWTVELPLAGFRALHPQLASSPAGLELTDVYALTVQDDVGLELNHIELLPANDPE